MSSGQGPVASLHSYYNTEIKLNIFRTFDTIPIFVTKLFKLQIEKKD